MAMLRLFSQQMARSRSDDEKNTFFGVPGQAMVHCAHNCYLKTNMSSTELGKTLPLKEHEIRGGAAVIVPVYKDSFTESEWFSFQNTLTVLAGHDVYIVAPEGLGNYFSMLKCKSGLRFDLELFADYYFKSIDGYNQLLMTIDFYRRFAGYDYVLIVQTDALVISDRLNEWCGLGYSYIGAPWFRGFDRPEVPISFLGVGNGGFSLRKVSDFIRVLSIPRYIPYGNSRRPSGLSYFNKIIWFLRHRIIYSFRQYSLYPKINEDHIWGLLVPGRCGFFHVPKPEDAISFAFELLPEHLFVLNGYRLPFGCHAWERYNIEFWRGVLRPIGINIP